MSQYKQDNAIAPNEAVGSFTGWQMDEYPPMGTIVKIEGFDVTIKRIALDGKNKIQNGRLEVISFEQCPEVLKELKVGEFLEF